VISPSQGRYLHRTTQTQNKRKLAGFKPTIPVFKRAKTFHALDRAATVTGGHHIYCVGNATPNSRRPIHGSITIAAVVEKMPLRIQEYY
jgi:hypothetical protein